MTTIRVCHICGKQFRGESASALTRHERKAHPLCERCGCVHDPACSAPHDHTPDGCPTDGLDCHPEAH